MVKLIFLIILIIINVENHIFVETVIHYHSNVWSNAGVKTKKKEKKKLIVLFSNNALNK